MKRCSLDELRRMAENEPEKFSFTKHSENECLRKNIPTHKVVRTVAEGTVRKHKDDEYSNGVLTKFTLAWRDIVLTVKNSRNPVIISVRLDQ